MKIIYGQDPIRGRIKVGIEKEVNGEKYLWKEVSRKRHYFNLVSGYAIQRKVFLELARKGYRGIYIKETDTGNLLYADIEDWKVSGSNWTGQNGNQQTLSEKYMIKR